MPRRFCILLMGYALFASLHGGAQVWYQEMQLQDKIQRPESEKQFAFQSIGNHLLIQNQQREIEWISQGEKTTDESFMMAGMHFASFDIEAICLNQADTTLYFSATHRGGKMRIYSSAYRNHRWTAPVPMLFSSQNSDDHYPYYDNDDQTLYFASRRTGSIGGLDIWACKKNFGGFDQPKNLGPGVNTPMNEMHPTICKKDLVFSSDQDVQNAGFDLRLSTAKSGFSSSLSLPGKINSSRNDLRLIQVSEYEFILLRRDHKKTEAMEWLSFTLDKSLPDYTYRLIRNNTPVQFAGVVVSSAGSNPLILESDSNGQLPIPAIRTKDRLQLKLIQGQEPCEFQVLSHSGEILFSIHLTPGQAISLEPLDLLFAKSERWYPGDESRISHNDHDLILPQGFSLCKNVSGEPIALSQNQFAIEKQFHRWDELIAISDRCENELPLIPANLPLLKNELYLTGGGVIGSSNALDCWRIDRIYFESSSDTLDVTALAQCRILREILMLNPGLQLELIGSTDFHGDADFNQHLGLQRAAAIKTELAKGDISSSRISTQSRGEICQCSSDSQEIKEIIGPVLRRVDVRYHWTTR